MWSSCPWVSTIACDVGRAGPGSDAKSGRIRSTPGCSTSGNSTPQSTISSLPSYSKTVMLRPIAPSPPSGMTRRPPSGSGGGGASSMCASVIAATSSQRALSAGRRAQVARAAGRSPPRWRRPAAAAPARPGRPSSAQAGLDQDRALGAEDAGEHRQQPPVQRQRAAATSPALVRLDHRLASRAPMKWVGRADHADRADRQQRQRERVVAGVVGQVGAGRAPRRWRRGRPWRP